MSDRVEVLKTYKLYVGGKFIRSESGHFFKAVDKDGKTLANLCRASRKDFKNAAQIARKAQDAWSERSAYNKGQILYRLAENIEARKSDLINLLQKEQFINASLAKQSVESAIDTFVYFAGWSDKYQAIFSSVNPVASSHFNFSILEPSGLVSGILDEECSFDQLACFISASIIGGNSLVVLIPQKLSLAALTLAEVIHHSDVPGGVINILSGYANELVEHMAGHMDVNCIFYYGDDCEKLRKIEELSELNLKRTVFWPSERKVVNSPYAIYDFQEVKTTWHPIEQIGGANSAY